MKIKKLIILAFCLMSLLPTKAGVNIKNGNFYITYADIRFEDKSGAWETIDRTYNSKSTYVGLFGYGWGTEMETFLGLYPDGTIVAHENGGGSITFFHSTSANDDMLNDMIDQIIKTAIKAGDLKNNPIAILERREVLKNAEQRTADWDKYVKKGLLNYVKDFPAGMEWTANNFGNQKLIRIVNGYLRNDYKGDSYTFNSEGKLVKLVRGNGFFSSLEYTNGKLSKIISANGSVININTNSDGFIINMSSELDSSSYTYNKNILISQKLQSGLRYKYSYDKNINLTSIEYIDNSKMLILYDNNSSAISVTTRNGDLTEYSYKSFFKDDGTVDSNHYATTVTETKTNENKIVNYYEFQIKEKANGDQYTAMTVEELNGERTTKYYDEFCNNPSKITSGDQSTTFKYNNRCLLIEKKTADDDIIKMEYHPLFDKITKVNNNGLETNFEYDTNKNLIKAERNDGNWVTLTYDASNNIITMKNENGTLNFEYNQIGKPTVISMENVGKINVTYNERGEILDVKSDSGVKIALKVTQSFQQMQNLVKPSGVNFNM